MGSAIDLKRVEQRAYRSSWDDGLLDCFGGLGLCLIGVAWITDLVVLGAVAPALLVPLWGPIRRALVEPRSGFVEFGPGRQQAERRKIGGVLVAGTLVLALGVAGYFLARGGVARPELWRTLVPALPAVLVGVLAAMTGALLGLRRYLVYALALVGAGALAAGLRIEPGWSLLAGGVVVLGSGAVLLARFLRDHPAPAAEGR